MCVPFVLCQLYSILNLKFKSTDENVSSCMTMDILTPLLFRLHTKQRLLHAVDSMMFCHLVLLGYQPGRSRSNPTRCGDNR
jgi:hypothetical protein